MIDFKKFEIDEDIIFSPIQKKLIELLQKKSMTRAEMVKEIGNSRTTIYDNLMGLMSFNIVKKYSKPTNSRGRPTVYFRLIEQ